MATLEDYRFVLLDSVERLRREAASVTGIDRYDQGRQMAYYEILQRILTDAETVGLTAAEVGLDGLDGLDHRSDQQCSVRNRRSRL